MFGKNKLIAIYPNTGDQPEPGVPPAMVANQRDLKAMLRTCNYPFSPNDIDGQGRLFVRADVLKSIAETAAAVATETAQSGKEQRIVLSASRTPAQPNSPDKAQGRISLTRAATTGPKPKAKPAVKATQRQARKPVEPVRPARAARPSTPTAPSKPVVQSPKQKAAQVPRPARRQPNAILSSTAATLTALKTHTPQPLATFLAAKQQEEAGIIQKPKERARSGLGPIETQFPDRVETFQIPRFSRELGRSVGLLAVTGMATWLFASAAQEVGVERTGSQGAQVASFVGGTVVNLYNSVSAPANAVEQLVPFSSK